VAAAQSQTNGLSMIQPNLRPAISSIATPEMVKLLSRHILHLVLSL